MRHHCSVKVSPWQEFLGDVPPTVQLARMFLRTHPAQWAEVLDFMWEKMEFMQLEIDHLKVLVKANTETLKDVARSL